MHLLKFEPEPHNNHNNIYDIHILGPCFTALVIVGGHASNVDSSFGKITGPCGLILLIPGTVMGYLASREKLWGYLSLSVYWCPGSVIPCLWSCIWSSSIISSSAPALPLRNLLSPGATFQGARNLLFKKIVKPDISTIRKPVWILYQNTKIQKTRKILSKNCQQIKLGSMNIIFFYYRFKL